MYALSLAGLMVLCGCSLVTGYVILGDGKLLKAARARERFHKRQITNQLPASVLSAEEVQNLLDLHNDFREAAGAGAGNMLTMEYADDLAALAQETANTCIFANANTNFPDNGTDVGQIIFRESLTSNPVTFLTALLTEEQGYYDYDTNTCQTGQTCENYRQVVWFNSNKMGCGKKFCGVIVVDGQPVFGGAWFWVCNYYEPSIEGDYPYLPSTEPCSLCNLFPGTTCDRNMCSQCEPTTDLNCVAQNETACILDNDSCCSTWDRDIYCSPGTEYYPYMSINCAAHCEINYCGPA